MRINNKKNDFKIKRRKAREIILKALYQIDIANISVEKILKFDWLDKDEIEIDESIKEFAKEIITGTLENLNIIDELIKKYSENWKFERISPVDKAILRFSIYSLLYRKDIPVKVVIDEAIEIGKSYSTEKSYQFINGILDRIRINELKENS
jgi:N utilization substance protein B